MTMTSITLTTKCIGLGVFLHHAGEKYPDPMPGVAHTLKRDLDPGLYAISVAGKFNEAGAEVKVTVKTAQGEFTDAQQVSDDGSIIAWFNFEIDSLGGVS